MCELLRLGQPQRSQLADVCHEDVHAQIGLV